jgi:kinetochore protein Spc24
LEKKVHAAKLSSQRPANVPTRAEHAQRLDELDNQRHQLVKAIEEVESLANDRDAEYARLKQELKELNERDVAEEADLDGTA